MCCTFRAATTWRRFGWTATVPSRRRRTRRGAASGRRRRRRRAIRWSPPSSARFPSSSAKACWTPATSRRTSTLNASSATYKRVSPAPSMRPTSSPTSRAVGSPTFRLQLLTFYLRQICLIGTVLTLDRSLIFQISLVFHFRLNRNARVMKWYVRLFVPSDMWFHLSPLLLASIRNHRNGESRQRTGETRLRLGAERGGDRPGADASDADEPHQTARTGPSQADGEARQGRHAVLRPATARTDRRPATLRSTRHHPNAQTRSLLYRQSGTGTRSLYLSRTPTPINKAIKWAGPSIWARPSFFHIPRRMKNGECQSNLEQVSVHTIFPEHWLQSIRPSNEPFRPFMHDPSFFHNARRMKNGECQSKVQQSISRAKGTLMTSNDVQVRSLNVNMFSDGLLSSLSSARSSLASSVLSYYRQKQVSDRMLAAGVKSCVQLQVTNCSFFLVQWSSGLWPASDVLALDLVSRHLPRSGW